MNPKQITKLFLAICLVGAVLFSSQAASANHSNLVIDATEIEIDSITDEIRVAGELEFMENEEPDLKLEIYLLNEEIGIFQLYANLTPSSVSMNDIDCTNGLCTANFLMSIDANLPPGVKVTVNNDITLVLVKAMHNNSGTAVEIYGDESDEPFISIFNDSNPECSIGSCGAG